MTIYKKTIESSKDYEIISYTRFESDVEYKTNYKIEVEYISEDEFKSARH